MTIPIHYVELKKNAAGSLEELRIKKAGSGSAESIRVRKTDGRSCDIAGAKNRALVDEKTGDMLEILDPFVTTGKN